MLRFIGIAMRTPSAAQQRIHGARTYQGRLWPSMSSIAGAAVPAMTLQAYPADEAVDCMQFVSRIDICPLTSPPFCKPLQMVNDRMHAVSATPSDHPALRLT